MMMWVLFIVGAVLVFVSGIMLAGDELISSAFVCVIGVFFLVGALNNKVSDYEKTYNMVHINKSDLLESGLAEYSVTSGQFILKIKNRRY